MPTVETTTFETVRLGTAIDAFEKNPTFENQSAVRLAFVKLDGEIAELQDRVVKTSGEERAEPAAKLNNLQRFRDGEMVRFTKAQDTVALNVPADSRSATQKMEDKAALVGEKIGDGSSRVGETIKKAAMNTGDAIKDATH